MKRGSYAFMMSQQIQAADPLAALEKRLERAVQQRYIDDSNELRRVRDILCTKAFRLTTKKHPNISDARLKGVQWMGDVLQIVQLILDLNTTVNAAHVDEVVDRALDGDRTLPERIREMLDAYR